MRNVTRVRKAVAYLENAERNVNEFGNTDYEYSKKNALLYLRNAISLLKRTSFCYEVLK